MACACGCTQPQFGSAGECGSACGCEIRRVRITRLAPPLRPLGELRGLIYRASRAPGEPPQNYVHFFEQPQLPVLTTDPTGRRLYIVGGRYRVTKRGIEG